MNSFVPLSREELIKEIKFINSKPKEFSAEQKAEKSNLESLLISLKEQWKTTEINSEEYQSITQKLTKTREQLNLLEQSLYNPEIDDQLLKDLEKDLKEIEDIEKRIKKDQLSLVYQGDQDFVEWEATIDKTQVVSLEIASSLKDNKLVIQGYPNLKELYALNRNLETAEINAPQLEILNLHGNSLQKLDVTNIPCLETLTISENRNLTQIIGFDKLDSLEELTCFNCSLEKLDCSNKKQLKKVCAANQFVDEFKPIFQGCDKLEIIDVAENKIRSLDCSDLINLKDVSCKENSFLKDNYSNIFEAFFFFFAEYDLNYEAKKNLTFENCYQGFFPFLILNVDKLINNNDKDKLLNYWMMSCERISEAFKRFKTLVLEKVNQETSQENFLLLTRLFIQNEQKNFFSLNANFSGCTSLEKLNFAKSNINNLNVDGCSSLQAVIGGWLDIFHDLDENSNEQHMLYTEPVEGGCFVEKFEDSDCESDGMEDSLGQEKTAKYYLTHAQLLELLAQIKVDKSVLNDYKSEIKRKNLKPPRNLETEPWYNPAFWEDKSKFPNLVSLHLDNEKANIYDDPEYGETIARYEEERELKEISGNDSGHSSEAEEQKKKNESAPLITHPSQLTQNNYPDLLTGKFGRGPEITITGGRLAGTLIIDGYQGQKINVGNNRSLRYLVVRNCPHLTTLRYAHCGLWHDAWYDPKEFNNPNLTIIDNYNWDGGIEWGNPEDEENEKSNQEEFKEELAQDAEEQKNDNLKEEFYKLLLEMLTQAENYADKNDWKRAEQTLDQIKQTVLKSHYYLSPAQLAEIMTRIKKLEQRLQVANQTTQPQSTVKIVVGSIVIGLLTIGLLFWLANKIAKKLLVIPLSSNVQRKI